MSKKYTPKYTYMKFCKLYERNKNNNDIESKVYMRNVIDDILKHTDPTIQHIKNLHKIDDKLFYQLQRLGYNPSECGRASFGSSGLMVPSPALNGRFGSSGLMVTSPSKN